MVQLSAGALNEINKMKNNSLVYSISSAVKCRSQIYTFPAEILSLSDLSTLRKRSKT